MASWFITGASNGLGYGLVQHLAADPANIIISLVRNKDAVLAAYKEAGLSQVPVVQADITDEAALQQAAAETDRILGARGLDVLVNNVSERSFRSHFKTLAQHAGNPQQLLQDTRKAFDVNFGGTILTTYALLPLIQKGKGKKVIAISSASGDLDFTNEIKTGNGVSYSATKAALNMLMAKFAASYEKDGILFTTICPGHVDSPNLKAKIGELTDEEIQSMQESMVKYKAYAPNFQGFSLAEASANVVRAIEERSIEGGHNGVFLSHNGTKRWL